MIRRIEPADYPRLLEIWESAVRSKLGTLGKYKLKSRTMNLAETELVVEAKLSQKQMDSLEALLDNEGVSDVNIVSYNGSTLL